MAQICADSFWLPLAAGAWNTGGARSADETSASSWRICGCRRAGRSFLPSGRRDLEADGLADKLFKGLHMPARGPELELGVAGGVQLQDVLTPAIVEAHRVDDLRVAAVEALGQPQTGGQHLDDLAKR